MLNLCHGQQCKLYIQIVVTNYIPNNIPSCHALDTNAALKQNNLCFLTVLVAHGNEVKRIIMSEMSFIHSFIMRSVNVNVLLICHGGMHLVKYKIAESSLTIGLACMLIWSSQYKVYN